MDATTQTLIADLISQRIASNWVFWLLFFVVSGLAAVAADFLKAYGRKRGEQLATKADFESLKEQLRATTRLTEEIKSEVGHIEWRMREAYTARRAKLEEFVQQIGTVETAIGEWSAKAILEEFETLDSACLNRLQVLARLYFPALYMPTLDFCMTWREIVGHTLSRAQALSKIDRDDFPTRQQVRDDYVKSYDALYREAIRKRDVLEQAVVDTNQDVLQFKDESPRTGPQAT